MKRNRCYLNFTNELFSSVTCVQSHVDNFFPKDHVFILYYKNDYFLQRSFVFLEHAILKRSELITFAYQTVVYAMHNYMYFFFIENA